jgi:F0F1-type ATP synthase assembly protein I
MTVVHTQLRQYLHRLLTIQALLVAIVAGAAYFRFGPAVAGALAYGGAIALTGTLILMGYGRRAEHTGSSLANNASLIFGSAITRFFMGLALFAVGIAVLRLAPLPLFTGFITGLLGQLISTALVPGTKTWRAKR